MNHEKLKVFNVIALFFGIFLTLAFSVYADRELKWFSLLPIVPYLLLMIILFHAVSSRVIFTVTLLGIILTLSTYFYFDSLFLHPDAQGALIFLFLPIYQLIALLVGFGISAIVSLIQKRKQ